MGTCAANLVYVIASVQYIVIIYKVTPLLETTYFDLHAQKPFVWS